MVLGASPTELSRKGVGGGSFERITLAFREELKNDEGKWVYRNPDKPHFGSDRAPYPGAFGTDIYSPFNGRVVRKIYSDSKSGYGNQLLIEFSLPFRAVTEDTLGREVTLPANAALFTRLAHCQELLVKVGDVVEVGQKVATMGDSGYAFGAHLHWEVISNGIKVDPELVLNQARSHKASRLVRLFDRHTNKQIGVANLVGDDKAYLMEIDWMDSYD